jgi:F-type H+-transporting ATPase subunit delta
MAKKITNRQLAKALYETLKDLKGSDLKKVLVDFVVILAREHKLKKSSYIIAEYVKYAKAGEGIQEIEITSARELDDRTVNHIKKAFGENTEATIKIDATLLGGVRVKTENKILDASLKTQLLKLKQSII